MHSTKKWDFSHPKNRLGGDRDIVLLIIVIQCYLSVNWILWHCSSLFNCFSVQSIYYLIYFLFEKLMGREKRKIRKKKNGFRIFSVIVSYIHKSIRVQSLSLLYFQPQGYKVNQTVSIPIGKLNSSFSFSTNHCWCIIVYQNFCNMCNE